MVAFVGGSYQAKTGTTRVACFQSVHLTGMLYGQSVMVTDDAGVCTVSDFGITHAGNIKHLIVFQQLQSQQELVNGSG